LERSKTAYGAMHVIIELLEKYGQCGDCEYQGEWGKANYHNSFLIADPSEAWVLETAGRYWVAKKLTHGVYSISNIYSIENDWDATGRARPEDGLDEIGGKLQLRPRLR
jgi:secernin